MADKYSTIQQHQPLRVPQGWSQQEKALIVQLDETFDDIYRRFGRLRIEDMGAAFRKSYSDIEGNVTELELDVSGLTTRVSSAEGSITTLNVNVSGLTTRVSTAEGDITSLNVRAGNIELSVANKYDKISGITITTDGIDVTGSKYVKIRSGGTFEVDSTNFAISSSQKKMTAGYWTLSEDGLFYENGNNEYGITLRDSNFEIKLQQMVDGVLRNVYLDASIGTGGSLWFTGMGADSERVHYYGSLQGNADTASTLRRFSLSYKNFNSLHDDGFYFGSTNNTTNGPSNLSGSALLEVMTDDYTTYQRLTKLGGNVIYCRTGNWSTGVWESWARYAGTI